MAQALAVAAPVIATCVGRFFDLADRARSIDEKLVDHVIAKDTFIMSLVPRPAQK